MDKSWMKIAHRATDERFKLGLNEFLIFAYRNIDESAKIPCPCRKCNNFQKLNRDCVFGHVMNFGMAVNYHRWIHHGESYEDVSSNNDETNNDDEDDNDLHDMLNEIGQSNWGENWHTKDGVQGTYGIDVDTLRKFFDDNQQQLYNGCESFTKFSFIVTLLHLKNSSGWTAKSFDALLSILKKALPIDASIPKNFYEAKKYIRNLGFTAEKIHVCVNDCVLFRKEYASLTECPNEKCKQPRYKDGSNIPVKVLRYFPLIPRLQRLFINEEVARDMRWHKEKREDGGNVIRHPADSEAWKHLDRKFPSFSNDSRSVRLGLATDGFNPFGHMNNAYSIWPVFLIPYNLPPWKCMKDPFFFISMLIPGPNSPGMKIDVYLQPMIDELNKLWVGVEAYDTYKREKFFLRAALLWTINDFPAYSMLSGRTVKGYKACPICMDETSSTYLKNSHKNCYMGHRRFLPLSHPWRKDKKNFDGNVEDRGPIAFKSGHDIFSELSTTFGDSKEFDDVFSTSKGKKRKRGGKGGGKRGAKRGGQQGGKQVKKNILWHKKSVFFELPYWVELKLRHNLDVMHIIKNVSESLVATIFNIKSKTKDTWKSRKDLMDQGLKSSLHLQPHKNSFIMPMASYHLTKDEKSKILDMLESLKFPDGFASNMARCIKEDEFQISGMKSHDFYVFIQRVMPLAIRGSLTKEIRQVLYELSEFIQKLCARNANIEVLKIEEDKIALILCKLERLFPPSFFDIMVHLLVHLPREAMIAGPAQYRWMFSPERKMGTLKGYVTNKAQPEGCIAERYIDNEILTFCSMYMHDVDTIFNKIERNNEMTEASGEIFVFSSKARPLGGPKYNNLNETELQKIHTYILNNSGDDDIDDLIVEHKCKLEEEGYEDIEQHHNENFASWFMKRVLSSSLANRDEIRVLARGPLRNVSSYTGCMVNGYKISHPES